MEVITDSRNNDLFSVGFTFQRGGVHFVGTMTLVDLETLPDCVPDVAAGRADFLERL